MSYQLRIDPAAMRLARSIGGVQRALQHELVESGLTQQEIATRIGVDRSVVNRRFKSSANLTIRSLSELAEAFGKSLNVTFVASKSTDNEYNEIWKRMEVNANLVPDARFSQEMECRTPVLVGGKLDFVQGVT
jgi:transcriptional regulator with XRE-family HTH domain